MTDVIDRLMELDAESPKRVAVFGDAVEDVWIDGDLGACQDGCPCFREASRLVTPGGAAGAARQLHRWHSEAWLVAPVGHRGMVGGGFSQELCFRDGGLPKKVRHLHGGRVVYRHDDETGCGPRESGARAEHRRLALQALRNVKFDAVLISDYDKGFLDADTVREIITFCRAYKVPCVADCKRPPAVYEGATLKVNRPYYERWPARSRHFREGVVVTNGDQPPFVNEAVSDRAWPRVLCVNHVGAGDCFAAHLTLGLAHGLELAEAALVAHAAGRVYVRHRHGRPPWPHEIRRDLDPAGGKVISEALAPALRGAEAGRVVMTNGVYRVLTAAHCEMLRWAKSQGDVLVVGVNDDVSAWRAKRGGYCLPLAERAASLAALECVDWVVPFTADTPSALAEALRPDVLVKGYDNAGTQPPGAEFAREVRFSPEFGGGRHASQILEEIRRG